MTGYVPTRPTTGWMISELERIGVRVRGTDLATKDKKMADLLRSFGGEYSKIELFVSTKREAALRRQEQGAGTEDR